MKKSFGNYLTVALGTLCLAASIPAGAVSIYNNSTTDLGIRFNPGTNEIGDEILLAGNARVLTGFTFSYWGTNTSVANATSFFFPVSVKLTLYQNNGTPFNGYATPGSVIWQSSWFQVTPTPRSTLEYSVTLGDFPAGGLFLPVTSNMTWSVQFTGMSAFDQVGLDVFSPPTVGGNYPDYWLKNGSTWELRTNSVGSMSFGATMEAVVPEPSSLLLGLLGGLGLLVGIRRFKRN